VIPVGLIFWRTFQNGVAPVGKALTSPAAIHAFEITLIVAGCAVVLNTIRAMIMSFLPLAVPPVVAGLALILVYGRQTTLGIWFGGHGIDIVYALPGRVMATAFVSLRLMVRKVAPILEEIGTEQEQAAVTLAATSFQTFRRITLPAIRGGVA
jgi:sulfate transport system permease protein